MHWLLPLLLAGCASSFGTNQAPPLAREGGTNVMFCLISVCNFQGTTGQVKEGGDVKQESDATQEGKQDAKLK
jgi:hypothetical protein